MLDRESTFADEKIVELLKTKFIPVAIDQWYTRRQQDSEGDFWRKIAGQSPRNDFSKTTQGLFVASAMGDLIAFNNNRGPERIRELLLQTIANYEPPQNGRPLPRETVDAKYKTKLPSDAVVVRVSARVESGYADTSDPWLKIFQSATSRDNLWITAEELEELRNNDMPSQLAMRIARFHLIDNTRGEPPVWTADDIQSMDWKLASGQISAEVKLASDKNQRGYDVKVTGEIVFDELGKVQALRMIARGMYRGTGPFTLQSPPGDFPLVVSFTLADGNDIADAIPPHASRGWLNGYLRPGG